MPIGAIARRLGRSVMAVEAQVREMGLGKFTDNSEWIPLTTVLEVVYGRITGGDEQRRMRKKGIPFHEKTYGRKRRVIRAVYIPELWPWLYENRRKIDFSRIEENIFGVEPAWVKEKRRFDVDEKLNGKRGGHNASWEAWEDEKFRRMMRKGVTIRDAAKELRKKERALIVRRKVLGIEEHFIRLPARRWTDEDVETLLTCFDKGMSWRQIGELLDRGAYACEAKYKKLQNPGYFDKNNVGTNKRVTYKGITASAAEVREVMQLNSIGALDGFEEAPEIGGYTEE